MEMQERLLLCAHTERARCTKPGECHLAVSIKLLYMCQAIELQAYSGLT